MRRIALLLVAALLLAMPSAASAEAPGELLTDGGVELGAGNDPFYWIDGSWQTDPTAPMPFALTWDATDAHSGKRSLRVDVTGYKDGDGKWMPTALSDVRGGEYYVFSDWYKSDVSTAVSVYYETDAGKGTWANLFAGIAPASTWTQYKTGFTMPADARRARFVHFIARDGYLATDDYSLTQSAAPEGFSRPLVSLTFDDGSRAFHRDALPLLNAKGFKTTQYIPTQDIVTGGDFVMTPQQLKQLAAEGHEIGSHTITHPNLTKVSDAILASELGDSRAFLQSIGGLGPITSIAYPLGEYDARVIAAAQRTGYLTGRSVVAGYNAKPDLEGFGLRVQNMKPDVSPAEFASWLAHAKAHKYWLIIVYHEVQPDGLPLCPETEEDPEDCVGPYDTTLSNFQAQLDAISAAGMGPDVMTVSAAMAIASLAPTPTPTPTPTATATPTATPLATTTPGATATPGAAVTPAPAVSPPDRTAPRISILSPRARRYKAGTRLTIRYSCADPSGIATIKVTLRRRGSASRTVRQGAKVRVTRTGTYTLRVTATDRARNTATKSVTFRVVRR